MIKKINSNTVVKTSVDFVLLKETVFANAIFNLESCNDKENLIKYRRKNVGRVCVTLNS